MTNAPKNRQTRLDAADRERLCADLERTILSDIPLARAMQVRIGAYDGASLALAAALAPNVNDKGCAFGGSLTSLMTLAGWGLVKLALDARDTDCDIYVRDSRVRYLAPVWHDFGAVARLADGETFEGLFQGLGARGKARIDVCCRVPLEDAADAATFSASFVAIARR
ncbi:MAG TPA: YiiD C-terminal domain-containing protein [Rhodanobacteraceae bacterium]|nr:YiiD C-terminal domain-containing protein [Rhodanobacteraceae bacterium]